MGTAGSSLDLEIDGLIIRASYNTATTFNISILPASTPVLIDLRRLSVNSVTISSTPQDNVTLGSTVSISGNLNSNSNSITWIWFRVQNPTTLLWNEYEVNVFISSAGTRASMWAYLVEEDVSYS